MAGTTNIPLTAGQYTDLGTAPALVQALGGTCFVVVADSQPANNAAGTWLAQNEAIKIDAADGSSHIWARAVTASGASVTPIYSSGGGGGGGAVTIADGADVAEGATTATAYSDGTGAAAGTVVGLLKGAFVKLAAILGVLPSARGQQTMAGSLSVAIASNQSSVPVTPATDSYGSSVTITRPANTTRYSAGAVVGGVQSFSSIGPAAGGQLMITSTLLNINDSAVISGEGGYLLALYSASPGSAYTDGAVWDLPSGDRASYLGTISLGAPVDLGFTLSVATDIINKQVTAASGTLYGYLITVGAYTPTSGRVYVPAIHTIAV